MATKEPSLGVALANLFASYDGRDRLARFLQYTARFMVGCTEDSSDPVAKQIRNLGARLLTSLGSARRTFRWGKEVGTLLHLRNSCMASLEDPVNRILEISQTVFLLLFLFGDHITWIQQIRVGLRGGARSIQLSHRCLALSCLLAVFSGIRRLSSLPKRNTSEPEDEAAQDRRQYVFSIVRNSLMTVQMAHTSSLFPTHNMLVGLFGMVSSLMDISKVWQEWRLLLEAWSWPQWLENYSETLTRVPSQSQLGWGPFWGVDEKKEPSRTSFRPLALDYARSD